jgi:hypothetical protein
MINNRKLIQTIGFSLAASVVLIGCGGGSSNTDDTESSSESNIPYLKENHANYSEHGSTNTPAPTKDASKKSIDWTIAATTEEGAEKLAGHIGYMDNQLKEGENPRAFDKLFLMEAYMKFNGFYTTSVERSGTTVVVSKVANTTCAYDVISAHSDAVSGDFFGLGDLNNDYSSIAEGILASNSCTNEQSSISIYISEKQTSRN